MRVSVIIVNYNGKHHLKECLESLQDQTYTDFEVILVDNNSADGSVEFVKGNFAGVKVIAFDWNSGYTTGNNIGVKEAKGEYVLLLNNDTALDKGCLENLVRALDESAGDIISVFPKVMFYTERNIINSYGVIWNHKRQWRDNRCGLIDLGQFKKREVVFGSMFVAPLLRKDAFEKIGMFDEDFFCYGEDFDVSYRANLMGYRFILEPRAKLYHKFRSSSGQERNFYWSYFFFLRNYWFVFIKNVELRNLIRYFPYFSRYLVYPWLQGLKDFLAFRDRSMLSTATRATFAIIRVLPSLLKKRFSIQRSRKRKDNEFWNFDNVEDVNIFYYDNAAVLNLLALRKAMYAPQSYEKDGRIFTTT